MGCAGAAPRGEDEPPASVDPTDRCPDAEEDEDVFEDDDGCPDPDNDGDAVLDVDDLCPCHPEDVDGWEDSDGCPDPDDDGDRIPDACDRCPRDAERYNGHCDEDGCPDRGAVLLIDCQIRILDRIGFTRGRSVLATVEGPRLDAIAASVSGNPQLERLTIRGHAHVSERGAEALALARATAVRDALTARGIPVERLAIVTAPPVRTTDDPYRGRVVDFLITRWDGTEWPDGNNPGGCGRSEDPIANEPATCDPMPLCTYVEDDRCSPSPEPADAPTPR